MAAAPPTTAEAFAAEQQRVAAERKAKRESSGIQLFDELPEKLNFVQMEEQTNEFWKRIDAFQTSIRKSEGRPRYTFYDGPPFATGLPHYGHLLAGTIKDVVCRFAHQTGHYVERRFGWDCHGLPIEFEIEKSLGIKSSHDVKALGIEKYNAECRSIVMRYAGEWERIVARSGRWIDFKNDYKTMNMSFMESVWWVFSELWKKKLVYRDFRVMPYSTGCTTPLSNFEKTLNYKDTTDPSACVTFPLMDAEDTHVIAWTTTPWTLPSNLALCVNADFDYLKVKDAKTGRLYIFAECRLDEVYLNHAKAKEPMFTIVEKFKGATLVGKQYVPLFDYFESMRATGAFRIVSGDFVTADAGTGVVHCAPGFGEDDFAVCKKFNVVPRGQVACPVDENGCFTNQVPAFVGRHVKECDNDILALIKTNGRLHSKASIVHSYPYCWRSETPLIYRAIEAWFVNVESFKDRLVETNKESTWVPEFVQTKRFSNWLEDARDWNVSRNRYWGTPLPIWHSEDWEEIVCIGSVAELEEKSGVQGITDLHREFMDKITIPSKRPGQPPLKRVAEVFDCWFESGSMPFAQSHYPFENKETFEQSFPADFIAEGLDQTRGWFYTLLVLSTAIMDKTPYKNLVVNGLVLAADGKKMSKRLKNYPEVMTVIDAHGADALRLYLINSPVVRAESLKFKEEGVKEVVRDVFIPLANAFKLFTANANNFLLSKKKAAPAASGAASPGAAHRDANNLSTEGFLSLTFRSTNLMDRWISAAAQTLVKYVHAEMAAYRLYNVVPAVLKFVESLTNWYVRMNRKRLKGQDGPVEWEASLSTLFQVMFTATRIMAPFTPFMAEAMYQCMRPQMPGAEESVHYLMVPEVDSTQFDAALETSMDRFMTIIELVRTMRNNAHISIRMPVKSVTIVHSDAAYVASLKDLVEYIKLEINAVEVKFSSNEDEFVTTKLDANFAVVGKKHKKEMKDITTALKTMPSAEAKKFVAAKGGVVAGVKLEEEDFKVIRETKAVPNHQSGSDGTVVVLMNTDEDQSLKDSYIAREFVTRVQQLRKSAGLQLGDVVNIFYATTDAEVNAAIVKCNDQIAQTIRSGTWTAGTAPEGSVPLISAEEEVAEVAITVTLVRAA